MNSKLSAVLGRVERVMGSYNPDNDVMPNQPNVLYVEMELALAVSILADVVGDLERKMEELENEHK